MEILITGGARGLGRYLALYFNELGHNVVVNYNKSENEAKDLEKNYGLKTIKADVSLEEDVKVMFGKIDKVDVIINNAAICDDKEPLEKTALSFRKVLETNLIGPFLVCKYGIKKMTKGCIINISSTNAINTYYPESMDYDASKSGLISLGHNFAKYLSSCDIRVNTVCPDWIDTSMNDDMDEEYRKSVNFVDKKKIADTIKKLILDDSRNDEVITLYGND
mgnify:FL=1